MIKKRGWKTVIKKWLCILACLTLCFPVIAQAADGELMYGAGGVQQLRTWYKQQSTVTHGPAPHTIIKALIARADQFKKTTYSYQYKTFQYTLSDQPPKSHKGDNFPYWTAMFQEKADSITTRINTLTFAYLVTQNDDYRKAAHQIVSHLVAWPHWSDPDYTCYGACLDTGHLAFSVGYYYDAARSSLSSTERTKIATALADKALKIIAQVTVDRWLKAEAHNIHAILAMGLALGAAAIEKDDNRATGWFQTAIKLTQHYLKDQGADGSVIEYHGYGAYAMDHLVRVLAVAASRGTPITSPFLSKVSQFYLASLAPDGSGVGTFGDSWSVCAGPTMFYMVSQGDAYAQAYLIDSGLIHVQDFVTVGWSRGNLTPKRLTGIPYSAPHVGFGSIRSNQTNQASLVVFKSGPPKANAGHNQFDHLTFNVWGWGSWLLGDPGYSKPGSQTPPLFRYMDSALGHNTILLDGLGPITRNNASIEQTEGGKGFGLLCGEAASSYPSTFATSIRRCIAMHPDGWLLVLDRVETPSPRSVQLLFQPPQNGQVQTHSDGSYFIQTATGRLAIRSLKSTAQWNTLDLALTKGWSHTLVATLPPPSGYQTVTLTDPSFEKPTWNGWTPRATTATGHTLAPEGYQGKQSAKIELKAPQSDGYLYSEKFPVSPGNKLILSAYLKTKEAASGARIRLIYWKADGAYLSDTIGEYVIGTWGWHKRTITGTVPTNAARVSIALELRKTGAVWFDQVELSQLNKTDDKALTQHHTTLLYPIASPSLFNGGFSYGMMGWTPRFSDNGTHGLDQTTYKTNAPSGVIKHTTSNEAGYFYGPNFSVKAGNNIHIAAWLKLEHTAGNGAQLRVFLYDVANKLVKIEKTPYLKGSLDWKQQSIQLTIPNQIVRLRFGIQFEGSGTLWVDDASYANATHTRSKEQLAFPGPLTGDQFISSFTRNQTTYTIANAQHQSIDKTNHPVGPIQLSEGLAIIATPLSHDTTLLNIKQATIGPYRIALPRQAHTKMQVENGHWKIEVTAKTGQPTPENGTFVLTSQTSIDQVTINGLPAPFFQASPNEWWACWGKTTQGPCQSITEPKQTEAHKETQSEPHTPELTRSEPSIDGGQQERQSERQPDKPSQKETSPTSEKVNQQPDTNTTESTTPNNGCGCSSSLTPSIWLLLLLLGLFPNNQKGSPNRQIH